MRAGHCRSSMLTITCGTWAYATRTGSPARRWRPCAAISCSATTSPWPGRTASRASVVVQTVTVPGETPELLALAATSDLIAGVVGWADLTAPGLTDRIAELTARPGGDKLVGLRHQVQSEPDPDWLTRGDVLRGLAAVAGAGLVYDLVITAGQLPRRPGPRRPYPTCCSSWTTSASRRSRRGAPEPWDRDLRRLAALPNTAGKLSGLVTEADWTGWQVTDLRPYTETALDAFGPGRVMFGSDWPVCTLAAGYGEVLQAARDLTGTSATPNARPSSRAPRPALYRLRR